MRTQLRKNMQVNTPIADQYIAAPWWVMVFLYWDIFAPSQKAASPIKTRRIQTMGGALSKL
jgi:hypothetical protein